MKCHGVKSKGLGLAVCCPAMVMAMEPLSDKELSDVQGQADMISIDRIDSPGADDIHFQRVTLGLDTELQTNIERFELGIDPGSGEGKSSDTLIENLSLGFIQDSGFFERNPDAPRMLRDDGTPFADGEIVPFKLQDPFIEIAHKDGSGDPVGVRFGFRNAEGIMSGSIRRLTGNINVDIRDEGDGLRNANSQGNGFDRLLTALTPVLAGSSPVEAPAQLVHGPGSPNVGEIRERRAEYIGVPNGRKFLLEDVNGAVAGITNLFSGTLSSQLEVSNCSGFGPFGSCDVTITAQGCEVIGIQACFDLDQFGSIPVGEQEEVDGQRTITGPASGLFISAQNETVEWIENIRASNPTREDLVEAGRGTFFNVPNESITLNLREALTGTERMRTEFIDRGQGLF